MPPVLTPPPRDTRLDVIRGWMQLSIFISHVAGSVFLWGIHASWGLSDSSEQFILLSGIALGSVFTLKAARQGERVAWQDLRQRTWRLWLTHLIVFFMFAAVVLAATLFMPLANEAARLGWTWFAQRPWFAIPGAAVMLYQPEFTGILPVFVWCMLVLPGFLWLAARTGPWALVASGLVWGAVQLGWIATPALGGTTIAFDPLAWQFLYMIGAYGGRASLLSRGHALPRHKALLAAAGLVVVGGLVVRLMGHGFLPGPAMPARMLLEGKSFLAPLPLLHALSLAYLVAVLVPREQGWMLGSAGRALAAIGRHSLHVFCVGLFLSWGVTAVLATHPMQAAWLDLLLVPAGIGALVMFARLADQRRMRQRSARTA